LSKPRRSIAAIAGAAALAVPSLAGAQHPAALGNPMIAFIQPRHIKLGLAGNEQNWPMPPRIRISGGWVSPFEPRPLRHKPPATSGMRSGAEGAPKSVTSAVDKLQKSRPRHKKW
jgi:hypothetical protein